LKLFIEHGDGWKVIGNALDRMPLSCRDKWREEKHHRTTQKGKWTKSERRKLEEHVRECIPVPPDGSTLAPVFWEIIANRMNGVRTSRQCRQQWYRVLERRRLSTVWTDALDRKLIEKLIASGAEHMSEVPWNTLMPKWRGSFLQWKYQQLTKRVEELDGRSFSAVLDKILNYFSTAAPRAPTAKLSQAEGISTVVEDESSNGEDNSGDDDNGSEDMTGDHDNDEEGRLGFDSGELDDYVFPATKQRHRDPEDSDSSN